MKCDDKNERYIVNGDHSAQKLQETLDGFITKFVLCQSCKNPETDIVSYFYLFLFILPQQD